MKFIAIKTDDGTIKGKLAFYCRMLHVSRQGFYKYLSVKDRPWKYQTLADTMLEIHAEDVKKLEYQDNTDRIEVERTFSLSKRCYGMSCITTKLEETQLTSIALSVFVTNLFRIQRRILYALLHLFRFWHDWNRYKSWKLRISA